MRVLVTGGAGYIGSHTALWLLREGHDVVLLDNLSRAAPETHALLEGAAGRAVPLIVLDLLDEDAVARLLEERGTEGVVHCAGLKSVEESVAEPALYELNNVDATASLARAMRRAGVRRVVFSSTATVYSPDESPPVDEQGVLAPINPYGWTKLRAEEALRHPAIEAVHLRYFNAVGADPEGQIGEAGQGSRNLLPILLGRVALGRTEVEVFGGDWPTPDGTCVRDYVHVADVARANALALQAPVVGGQPVRCNVGTGRGSSVLDVVREVERATGVPLRVHIAPRRPGDVAVSVARVDNAARHLGFRARFGLSEMVDHAVRWAALRR